MSRIKSAKRYKIWGTRGFCCKFEEFRAEHPIDEFFLTIYKDYKSIFVKEAAESADENMKNLLQYIYENQNGILEYRERMKKITHKIRIK